MSALKCVILFGIVLLGLVSCEDQVNVSLDDAPPVLVIDAWVNNKEELQIIRLTKTQPYFDSSTPDLVAGAEVSIVDNEGDVFPFTELEAGVYAWNPSDYTERFILDRTFTLQVVAEGTTFQAVSQMKRVPVIDSLVFSFKEERNPFQPEGYYGEFFATDLPGIGDAYWIKSYKNGQLLNRPFELMIAFDAGFNEGGNIDGVVFIQPIQESVNPFNEDMDAIAPYQEGDSLHVEIHSLNRDAFYFLQQVQIQTQRDGGFDEIFAEPLENVQTNFTAVAGGNEKVVGWFNVAAVAGLGKKVEP